MKSVNVSRKTYSMCKKDYNWNPSTYICENDKNIKYIADTSVIVRNEFINATGSVSISVTNIIPINVTTTISINSDLKKVRYKTDFVNVTRQIHEGEYLNLLHKTILRLSNLLQSS